MLTIYATGQKPKKRLYTLRRYGKRNRGFRACNSARNLQKLLKLDYGTQKCEVCAEAQSKYKCPICLIPYCSLMCFKKHKEIPCKKPKTPVEDKVSPASTVNDEKPLYVEKPSEVLQGVQLELIASSSEIRYAIKDEKLKKLICDIDSAVDPEKELDKVMDVEEFRRLTEKILSTITP